MLALATHEAHFHILREVVLMSGKPAPGASSADDVREKRAGEDGEKEAAPKPYCFLRVNVLREYLQRDMHVAHLPFKYDPERVYDDFVFMYASSEVPPGSQWRPRQVLLRGQ